MRIGIAQEKRKAHGGPWITRTFGVEEKVDDAYNHNETYSYTNDWEKSLILRDSTSTR